MLHKNVLKLLFPINIEGDFEADLDLEGSHLDDVQTRADDFLTEIFPDIALELLDDWERVTGFPDDCTGVETDPVKRRNNIVSRISNYGGLSQPYFIQLADNLGYTITIREFPLFRIGMSGMGDYIRDPDFQFVWEVTVAEADSGTTDGVAANKLIDSGQNFLTTVEVGMSVKNTTDTTSTIVASVDSDTQLTLDDDIFISGENYQIIPDYTKLTCNFGKLKPAGTRVFVIDP